MRLLKSCSVLQMYCIPHRHWRRYIYIFLCDLSNIICRYNWTFLQSERIRLFFNLAIIIRQYFIFQITFYIFVLQTNKKWLNNLISYKIMTSFMHFKSFYLYQKDSKKVKCTYIASMYLFVKYNIQSLSKVTPINI